MWRGTFAILLLAVVLLPACARSDPEQALRGAVHGLRSAIEAHDASALQQFLAEDFVGNDGLDRDGARRMATIYLLRHADIGVNLGPLDVAIQERHATVGFTAALTGGSGRLLPDAARVHEVRTAWRLEDGEWKLTSASWKPVL